MKNLELFINFQAKNWQHRIIFFLLLITSTVFLPLHAETPTESNNEFKDLEVVGDTKEANNIEEKLAKPTKEELKKATLSTLLTFVELEEQLRIDIKELRAKLKAASTETEKVEIKTELETAEKKLNGTIVNLENIAADTDLGILRTSKEEAFNLQKELFSLLEPAIKEMKHATSDVRLRAELRDKITYYQDRKPIAEEALSNIAELNKTNKNPKIKNALSKMHANWSKQLVFIQSELQANQLQLNKLEATKDLSLSEKSESFFKDFFQRRGWTLIQAFLTIIGVLIVSRLIHHFISRTVKGYRAEHRGVELRVIDLLHRIITFLLVLISPLIIFYIEEDWVLFSLGVLLLFGIALALRQAIPRYWGQLELFLNIGPVREGERLMIDHIPWRVKHINMYSVLENPVAGLNMRIDIDDLVDLRSRPIAGGEPWFPCKKGDWVILKDGVRGKVIGLSIEVIQLIQRGGAVCTYNTEDFLSLSPINLSKNFRIKETIGISYSHQKESTSSIIKILEESVNQRAIDEGYKDAVISMRVEFEAAADSSLNLVVIADFQGSVADIYMRLRRSIQRWCVDTCTDNDWEIPFPQLTVHPNKMQDNAEIEAK